MQESPLTPWAPFYTIVGSSSAALTGLMFVAITLVTGTRVRRPDQGIATFSTPTVLHFCQALAIAAILCAPWHVLWHAGLLLGITGVVGLAYTTVVMRRIRRQDSYLPIIEDWLWHVVFPLFTYIALIIAAIFLSHNAETMLFVLGAAAIALLFIGIHNAWDNVTYIVVDHLLKPPRDPEEPGAKVPNVERAPSAP